MRSVAKLLIVLGLGLAVSGANCAAAKRPADAGTKTAPAPKASPAPQTGPRTCAADPEAPESPGADPVAQALRHYVRGRLYMAAQDNLRAAREFQQAAALAPRVPHIWLNLGLARYDSGNVSGAVEALDMALKLAPSDPQALYFRARIARSQNDTKTAADLLTRLLNAAPKMSPYLILGTYHLAQVCQELGQTDKAITHYESLLKLTDEPQSFFQRYPDLYLLYRNRLQLQDTLARLYLERGANDKAIAVLRDALSERPDQAELLSLICQACIQKKDYAAARDWAKKWIEIRPDDGGGYQRLVEAYRAEGKLEAAIPELEAYRRARPDSAILALQLAAAYKSAGQADKAAGILRELVLPGGKTQATSVAAALELADLDVKAGRPVEAIEGLGAALSGGIAESAVLIRAAQICDGLKDPAKVYQDAQRLVTDDQKNFGTFALVGMLAENLKKRDEAIALYDKAIARQPKAVLAYSRKADLLAEAGRAADALAVYEAAVKGGLDLPSFHRRMGVILEYLDRDEEALIQYRIARQAAPDDKPTRYLYADALSRAGKFDEAERELKGLLARFPTEAAAFNQLAAVYMAKGDFEAAEKAVGQARAIDDKAVAPRAVLAEIRYRQKRLPEAEKMARAILAEQADAYDVRLLLAMTLAAEKNFKDAAAEVKTLVAAQPENLRWRYLLAGIYSESGDTGAAEQELQEILKKKPDYAPASNDLGYMWADRGVNLAKAEELIRAAVKASPKNPAYLDSLGWVLYKRGQFEEAVRALQQATQAAPSLDAVLWDHLGDACWRLSRKDEAAKAWETAAKILESKSQEAKADDLRRVRTKVQSAQAGRAPEVAPLSAAGTPKPDDSKKPDKKP